jgi:hypothetical protein
MKRFFLMFALVLGVAGNGRAADDFFSRGIEAGRAGDFSAAAAAFQTGAKQQPSSGALVNLGLAEWQRGHAGAAILAWEQAQWIDPFDVRAKQNLRFARTLTQVDAPELKWFEFASLWLPPNAWVWVAGASLWLAVGAVTLPAILRRRKSGWQQTVAALGLCLFLAGMAANLGVVSRTQIGFVLKRNAPLRLTPTREAEVVSTLNAGEPARRLRSRGDYYFIRTAYGAGWIQRGEFGLVNPE